MKRILSSLIILTAVLTLVAGSTVAFFSDTETSVGNTFAAGTLDLKVDGEDDPFVVPFELTNLTPGSYHDAGTVTLSNAGTIDGRVSLKIQNPFSNENTLEEPEEDAGDEVGVEKEFGSYDANDGDGELWDSLWIQFYVDGNEDGHYEGGYAPHFDCIVHDGALDKSSYYSFPIDTELMPMNTDYYCTYDYVDLAPGETVDVGVRVYFFSDAGGGPAGGWSSEMPPTNMAMSDDATFDIVFGLEQITP